MSQVSEATARYHKLIESEPYIDLAWAEALQARLRAEKLVSRPLSPVLRPHFLTTRDYAILGKDAATVFSAIDRAEQGSRDGVTAEDEVTLLAEREA